LLACFLKIGVFITIKSLSEFYGLSSSPFGAFLFSLPES